MELCLAKVLKDLLKNRRLTLKEVSLASGVAVSTLGEWLNNRQPKSPVQVKKVANTLEVSLNYLLFGEPDRYERINLTQALGDEVLSGVFEINVRRVKIDEK